MLEGDIPALWRGGLTTKVFPYPASSQKSGSTNRSQGWQGRGCLTIKPVSFIQHLLPRLVLNASQVRQQTDYGSGGRGAEEIYGKVLRVGSRPRASSGMSPKMTVNLSLHIYKVGG